MTQHRPDPDSQRYADHWEPVLAAAGRRLMARFDRTPELTPATFLDVGAGTGSLTTWAAGRWPSARIVALDASAGMLSVARARIASQRADDAPDRFVWLAADAADIPLDDASVDVAASAFMLQMVDDRPTTLADIRRVLRPGGELGLVTWIAGSLELAADDAFEDALAELGLEEDGGDFRPGRAGDYDSLDEAADELATAGFDAIDVRADELRHAWTPASYLTFKEQYDARELFDELSSADRERLRSEVSVRLEDLPQEALEVRAPLVSATACRPGR